MDKQKDSQLIKTLPSSISQDDLIQNLANAISNNLNVIEQIIPLDAIYANIDRIPGKLLDSLAWQFHMELYNDTADIGQKREWIKKAIKYHRYKGTAWALKAAVESVTPQCKVLEWFEYSGKPYHFKVSTEGSIESTAEMKRLIKAIKDAKNVRSWLDGIQYRSNVIYKMFIATSSCDREALSQEIETIKNGQANLCFGIMAERTVLIEIHGMAYEERPLLPSAYFACGGAVEREVLHGT